jgi:hypothetical protein
VKFLDRMTQKNGIASEGSSYALDFIQENRTIFQNFFFENDRLFGVKTAYLLDRVFQKFVNQLATYRHRTHSITAARGRLKGKQMDHIDIALQGIEFGIMPVIHLPESLTTNRREAGPDPESDHPILRESPPSPKKVTVKTKSAKANPNPISEWGIPKGKGYGAFFSPREGAGDNLQNWPTFPHHDPPSKACQMCVKFQVIGKCHTPGCRYAHIDPKAIDNATQDVITTRLQKIYHS